MTFRERSNLLEWLAQVGALCLEEEMHPAIVITSLGTDERPGVGLVSIPTLTPELTAQCLRQALHVHCTTWGIEE